MSAVNELVITPEFVTNIIAVDLADETTFTTADKAKLNGIEAGAQVNTVTRVAGKTGVVELDAGDIGYDGSTTYDSGTVGKAVSDLNRQISEVTGNDIPELKSRLDAVYYQTDNLYNPNADTHGVNLDNSGVETSNAEFKTSDYIYVGDGDKVTIQCDPNQWKIYFFTSNSDSGYSRVLWITGSVSQTFVLRADEKYIRITMKEAVVPFMVNMGDTLLPFAPYGNVPGTFLQGVIDDIDSNISAEANAVRNSSAQIDVINRFDKSAITAGNYLSTSNGSLTAYEAFFASDYIDISDLEIVACCETHIVCFYKADKTFVSGQAFDTLSADNSIARPNTAKYMRFSTYNGRLDTAQIGENVTKSNYVPFGKYTLPNYIPSENIIIVDVNGNGDYTSLTAALYETVNSGVNIKVMPGTYNIVNEYIAKFGETAVNNMADSDSSTFSGFQYGAIIRNRTIVFESGAYVVCDWAGHTVDGTHRFSALRVDYNCKIIGLHLTSTATFYAIHDDYGLNVPYTVEYENCYVKGISLTNANCIGGGCKKYSRHILKNCYFDNGLTDSATVRYHNTNDDGAVPEIYVSNCYFNNWFTPRWYGTQTSKMRVYVNNCHARAIYKMAESSSCDVDNVELYKWNNEETDPIT